MHFDTPLIVFSAESQVEANIKIIEARKGDKKLLPLDLAEISEGGIKSWIRHRLIPKNRAHVHTLLSSLGLSINRRLDIIGVSKGLSLNDCYWFKQEDSKDNFDAVNLYDNRFSRALTGYGSSNVSELTLSPEFTTNGMLPKCWRRIDGKILGINVVLYRLSKWKNTLCSICELFTSKDLSFVPVGRIVRSGGMQAVKAYYIIKSWVPNLKKH